MKIQQVRSCATSNNDLFLSAFVDSTVIAVMINAFLIHLSVLAGQRAPANLFTIHRMMYACSL